MGKIISLNVKAIALSVFFISIFIFYQIKFLIRLKKLKKSRDNVVGNGFQLEAYELCGCCCEKSLCCGIEFCFGCFQRCFRSDAFQSRIEKREAKQSDEAERKTTDRRLREKKDSLAEIEQEKIERKDRIEALKESGYIATDERRSKIIDIVNVNPKTSLSWTSNSTNLPIEEIVLIIENEEDFEITGEYIINKKKILEKEDKRKIDKITCPNCENLFEQGSEFCPNCGLALEDR